MRVCAFRLAVLAAAVAATASAAEAPKHRADGDAAIAARRVLDKYCSDCHGGTKEKSRGADRLAVGDYRSLTQTGLPVPFVAAQPKSPSLVLAFLRDGSMPPGGRERPTKDEAEAVERWVAAGAPEFPRAFDEDAVLRVIADDFAKFADRPPQERGAIRYLSLAHLAGGPAATLRSEEAALAAVLGRPGAAAFDKLLTPLPASANTVYRLDLQELGWNAPDLFERWKGTGPDTPSDVLPMVPFDLIQLENPYPVPTTTDKGLEERVREVVAGMNPVRTKEKRPLAQLRAVPYLRADWLAKALSQGGKPTPLADELASLVELDRALRAGKPDKDLPDGPVPRPFPGWEDRTRDRPASASVWSWYPENNPDAKPPAGLKAFDDVDGKLSPEGGKLLLQAKAAEEVYLSLVEVWGSKSARVVKLVQPKEGKLTAGAASPVCPNADKDGTMRLSAPEGGGVVFFLVYASTKEPKGPPVVVGSRHNANKVFRVLPSEADSGPESKTLPVARAVVPIKIPRKD